MYGAVAFRVPQQCRTCDTTQIYPCGIYYYKEQGYDSQQVPTLQAFRKAVMDEKYAYLVHRDTG